MKKFFVYLSFPLIGLIIALILAFLYFSYFSKQHRAKISPTSVFYGAYVRDAPRDFSKLIAFENAAQKKVAIVHWYQGWGVKDGTQYFPKNWMDQVRAHGAIPMITWEPWDYTQGVNQPEYSLKNIAAGNFDTYITKWAQDSETWGHPYFLKFAHEMNGDWYPWSEQTNGNRPGDYIKAWKHVHNLFVANGATNVTWVWAPNVESSKTTPLKDAYPGDSYVDWVGVEGYNGGTALDWGGWQTFSQIFTSIYHQLQRLTSEKPMMISETASTEEGGSKADWITDAYTVQLPTHFPKVKAIVWFNEKRETDWRIESSSVTQTAFAKAVTSDFYASNYYANLNQSPIPPPDALPH